MTNVEESIAPDQKLTILQETRSFRGLEPGLLRALIEAAEVREIAAGEALFRVGDGYRNRVYILLEGTVVMRRADGSESDIQTGDFIGLANYLDEGPHASSSIAATAARVLEITSDRLHRLEQDQPGLFNLVNRVIAHKLRERSPERGIGTGALAQPVTRAMKSPVSTCGPELTLRQAFSMMHERRIGSLVVTGKEQHLLGVLTCSGLSEAALVKGARPDDSIMRAACQEPLTVAPDTPLWKAEEIQQRAGSKYLIVLDEGKPLGMISQTDILRTLIAQPSTLTSQIPQADSLKELAAIYQSIPELAAELQESNRQPSSAVRSLSETHLAIQRRTTELTLCWMERKGHGKPPLGFAVLVMGSGGRKEMLLTPDQDNGIILENDPRADQPEVKEWFQRFAQRLNRNLDRVGYILCPGEIMARNPLFHKTLKRWQRQIDHIADKPTEKAARWANIVFDFDTLYGDDGLTLALRRQLLHELGHKPRLLRMMAAHDAEGRPAIGLFNQLITTTRSKQGERIDLKRNGLRLIADAARIFALHNGVAAQNTTDRLSALVRLGRLSDDFSASISEAYEELLDLLLSHQIRQARQGQALDKLIDPEQLTPQSRSALRMAMRAVKRFQERLQDEFETEIF